MTKTQLSMNFLDNPRVYCLNKSSLYTYNEKLGVEQRNTFKMVIFDFQR